MSSETESRRPGGQKGYQPKPDITGNGYQPQANDQVDLSAVKPPQGDTAIVPPGVAKGSGPYLAT